MCAAGLWDELIGFKQAVGLMAQGQQRGLDATGKVFPYKEPSPQLLVSSCFPCSNNSPALTPHALRECQGHQRLPLSHL